MIISFIGAGNMASAIIKSVTSSGRVNACDVYVYDKFEAKSDELAKLGINKCTSLSQACNSADYILLAVKPQDYPSLLESISSVTDNLDKKTFISIAAGISCEYVCSKLGVECPVVRVMPNTPLMIGVGATAISRNSLVSDKTYSKICTLFAASGCVCSLDEELMNKVISVNSSSPVYIYLLAKAMIDKAVEYGISEKNASELVYQTIKGSAEMLIKSKKTPDELISMVASPGGTTLAAISSFNDNNFNDVVSKAMDACTDRAGELSK
ncbi:MAG: pyrroline-5-carboxylate reductase [Ruminococcaceae bacterium]|nr:pyrroline-5-carboxylate reductase [Oscillospiraceae bacterium]